MRKPLEIEWRYFSNIGKVSRKVGNPTSYSNYSNRFFSGEEDDSYIDFEVSPRFLQIVEQQAKKPVRVGSVTQALILLARRLSTSKRLWSSSKQIFLRFLVASLVHFFKSAYEAYLSGELDEEEIEAYEKEAYEEQDEDLEEEEPGAVVETEDSAFRKAYIMTRQFAVFLVTTYILLFVEKHKELLEEAEQDFDDNIGKVLSRLLDSLGLRIISPDLQKGRMHLIRLLKYYISDEDVTPQRFKSGQVLLSNMISVIVHSVVTTAAQYVRENSGKRSFRRIHMSDVILDDYRDSLYDELDEETNYPVEDDETDAAYDFEASHDEYDEYGEYNEYDGRASVYEMEDGLEDIEEEQYVSDTFSKIWRSIRPRYSSIIFAKRFSSRFSGSRYRTYSNRQMLDILRDQLYLEFRKLFSDDKEAKEAADNTTMVVEKALIEGLVSDIKDLAAKAAELMKEEAAQSGGEESDDESWWDKFLEDTEEEEKEDKNKEEEEEEEEVEEDSEEEGEDEEAEGEEEEEEKEEKKSESRRARYSNHVYFAKNKNKKILSKYIKRTKPTRRN